MGYSKSTNLKSKSDASFHSIFEEIYMKNSADPSLQKDEKVIADSAVNSEWVSVIESVHLLNRLYENDLRYTSHASTTAQTPYAKKRSTEMFHTPPPPPLQSETVIQSENPEWTPQAKQAFVFVNSLPTNSPSTATHAVPSTATQSVQQKLPVFFTATELKKIYRQRAKLTHPDRHGGSHTQFIELKKNCQILMDFSKKID